MSVRKNPVKSTHMSLWFSLLVLSTLLLSSAELLLINRKMGILTGGFLRLPLENWSNISLLCLTLLLANSAVLSIPLQAILWVGDRCRWSGPKAVTLCLAGSSLPLIITDMIWYELSRYFGDAASFVLIRTIGSGTLLEALPQAYGHLIWFSMGMSVALLLCYATIRVSLMWITFPPWRLGGRIRFTVTLVLIIASFVLVFAGATRNEQLNKAFRSFPATYAFFELLDHCSDWDRDGSGILAVPPDPAPRDARIYPFAPDIPGNDIDENGIMGDLPLHAFKKNPARSEPPIFKRRPHFALIILESFRADLLFRKEKGTEVIPNLNRLAAGGVAAERAFCHDGFTVGGLNAIFSGNPFNTSTPGSLFDDFKSNGYQVACFSGQDESFGNIFLTSGMEKADFFYDARQDMDLRTSPFATPASLAVPGRVVTERLSRFVISRSHDPRPLFLYINLQDTHFPYHHYGMDPLLTSSPLSRSEINRANQTKVLETYLNAAANVDAHVGRIVGLLEKNLDGELAVLVVSDHGESLFDDGVLGHGLNLSDHQMRILMIANGFPAKIEEPMGQDEIRAMIQKALALSPEQHGSPERMLVKGKRIFQNIGSLASPSRIGWRSASEQWEADLVRLRQRKNAGPWAKLGSTQDQEAFRDLVYYWESLQQLLLKTPSPGS